MLFHIEIVKNIYLISDSENGPTENGQSMAPGNPTGNSYLIIGEKSAVLFDLAVNLPDIHEYVKTLTDKPVKLVLSHGHYDHCYHLEKFRDVWMHPNDEFLLRQGMLGMPPVDPCPSIHYLNNGDVIELGNHLLEVIHIPGHTPGSILLLDKKYRLLFSGDTCARRLLYGLHGVIPFKDFCQTLKRLQEKEFDVFYSAHDRCAIPKSYLNYMINEIENEVPESSSNIELPQIGTLHYFSKGNPYTFDYFDIAYVKE